MKILFADKFPQNYFEQLQAEGHECSLLPDLTADDLPSAIQDNEILVVRSTKVTNATLQAASNLKLVIRAGAGTNTIDKSSARGHGISVCNVPGKNALAVAELAMGLLIAIDRNIPDNVIELRQGRWNKKHFSQAQGLCGRKMGIIGLGSIGFALAERAKAFGIEVHVISKADRDAVIVEKINALGIQQVKDMEALLTTCDILSFHVPSNDQTNGMINGEMLEKMLPGTIILNTSRGEIIDEVALIKAMDSKGIRAGVDVYAGEPGSSEADFQSELAKHPNVYGTHHIGASTAQAQNAVSEGVIEVINAYQNGNVINCVNI